MFNKVEEMLQLGGKLSYGSFYIIYESGYYQCFTSKHKMVSHHLNLNDAIVDILSIGE